MTSITTRAGKGSPLTHNEVDANFTNLNTDKLDTAGIALGSAASPTIKFTGDLNTGIYSPGADQLAISTGGTERLRIDSSGRVGIGTSAPGTLLDTRGFASYRGNAYAIASFCANNTLAPLNIVQSTNGTSPGISAGQDSSTAFQPLVLLTSEVVRQTISTAGTTTLNCNTATSPLQVQINSSEVARIDSIGRLLVGTSSIITEQYGGQGKVQIAGTDNYNLSTFQYANNNFANVFTLGRSRSTSIGHTILQSGDGVGQIRFEGSDGTGFITTAEIVASVDGTPGTNDMPGRLVFSTTADGASSPTERMRIKSTGTINFSSVAVYADNAAAITGGLAVGDVYRTSTGQLMIRY